MTYRDEFDDPPKDKASLLGQIGPKAAFFIVLIALSFMVGVVWKLYVGAGDESEQGVPIVRANTNPYKIIPEDPGGMEIPHQDSTIFSSKEEGEDKEVENLLADDENEEPMPRSQLFAGLNTEKSPDLHAEAHDTPLDKPVGDDAQRIVDQAEDAEQIVGAMVEEGVEAVVVDTSETVAKVEPSASPDPVEPKQNELEVIAPLKVEPKREPIPEPVKEETQTALNLELNDSKPTPKPVTSSGDYFIQLASIKDKSRAEAEWTKLQQKYGQLLGYGHRVESADLGARGMYYRIQAGPMAKDEASSVCDSIKRITPGGCLVKKR